MDGRMTSNHIYIMRGACLHATRSVVWGQALAYRIKASQTQIEDKQDKIAVVVEADAVVHPGTVVIHLQHTPARAPPCLRTISLSPVDMSSQRGATASAILQRYC